MLLRLAPSRRHPYGDPVAWASGLFAIAGVLIGGTLSIWGQNQARRSQAREADLKARQDTCVALLAAVRKFRRFVMYADVTFEIIPAEGDSKGTVIAAERREFDAEIDEAFARLLIVARSPQIVESAKLLTSGVNDFIRARATYGRGKVPNDTVRHLRSLEYTFAETVMHELAPLSP